MKDPQLCCDFYYMKPLAGFEPTACGFFWVGFSLPFAATVLKLPTKPPLFCASRKPLLAQSTTELQGRI